MTNPSVLEIAAYAAGGATVLAAFTSGVVSIITALKVTKIEAHVNSQKTAAEGRETTLKLETTMLREMLDEHQRTAALLAQAAALRHRPPAREILPEGVTEPSDPPSGH